MGFSGDSFVCSQLLLNTLRPAGRRGPGIHNTIMLRYIDLNLNSEQPAGLGRDDRFDSMGVSFMLPSEIFGGKRGSVADTVGCLVFILRALFQGKNCCSYFPEIEEQPGMHS